MRDSILLCGVYLLLYVYSCVCVRAVARHRCVFLFVARLIMMRRAVKGLASSDKRDDCCYTGVVASLVA